MRIVPKVLFYYDSYFISISEYSPAKMPNEWPHQKPNYGRYRYLTKNLIMRYPWCI